MSYTAEQHATVAERIRDYFRAELASREEGARLKTIIQQLAANGDDEQFADALGYTKAELLNVVSYHTDKEAFLTNGSVSAAFRTAWTDPFLV